MLSRWNLYNVRMLPSAVESSLARPLIFGLSSVTDAATCKVADLKKSTCLWNTGKKYFGILTKSE